MEFLVTHYTEFGKVVLFFLKVTLHLLFHCFCCVAVCLHSSLSILLFLLMHWKLNRIKYNA